jgi:hypothetical protein
MAGGGMKYSTSQSPLHTKVQTGVENASSVVTMTTKIEVSLLLTTALLVNNHYFNTSYNVLISTSEPFYF